ncbi:MAG: 2-C-methyl-D-erythritol 4-phosphate cytidylyltransferase [Ginsengibacter sp.]
MKKYAVIVAGGTGTRMKNSIPKQFLLLNNKPVLFYTINAFLKAYDDLQVILVLPETHIDNGKQIIDGYFNNIHIQLINGGRTRFHSVQNGLSQIKEESIIFVHDGVRCLLTTNLIHRCYDAAIAFGTAIPVITSKDSVRIIKESDNEAVDRNIIKLVQTPQTFHSKILQEAYKTDYKDNFTDEASVAEAYGVKVHLIEGEKNNIKITDPIDLMLAENIINSIEL